MGPSVTAVTAIAVQGRHTSINRGARRAAGARGALPNGPGLSLIENMLRINAAVERMRERAPQSAYLSTAVALAIGRPRVTRTEGIVLRGLGWHRTVRERGGRRFRAWLPPRPLPR